MPKHEQAFHVSGWAGCLWFFIMVVLAGAAGGVVVALVVR
jgi:hypothetical protein